MDRRISSCYFCKMPILENEIKIDIGPGIVEVFAQITHLDNVEIPPYAFSCMACLQKMEAVLRIQASFIRANEVIPVPEIAPIPEVPEEDVPDPVPVHDPVPVPEIAPIPEVPEEDVPDPVPVHDPVPVPEIIANNAVQPEVPLVDYSSSDSFDSSDDPGNVSPNSSINSEEAQNESNVLDGAPARQGIEYPYSGNRVRRAGTMNENFFMQCPDCRLYVREIRSHVLNIHTYRLGNDNYLYQCQLCGKLFGYRRSLVNHLSLHP